MSEAILVLDGNTPTREMLTRVLEHAGYHVVGTATGFEAFDLLARRSFTLIIADAGTEVAATTIFLSQIQHIPGSPAVILLGTNPSCEAVIAAFRGGAADYLLKPVTPEALQASVATVLTRRSAEQTHADTLHHLAARLADLQSLVSILATGAREPQGRNAEDGDPAMVIGALRIGRSRREVLVDGGPLSVTPTEYRLLRCLAEAPHQPVPCRTIVRQTHNYDASDDEAAGLLKSHVRNLRRKLPREYLVTVRGTGYMLAPQTGEGNSTSTNGNGKVTNGNGKLHAVELGA